ncbi:MAG: YggT family protein [Syntrophaceae bacterium]|nr:YggT family protein [Syntrophaceae bacterium]
MFQGHLIYAVAKVIDILLTVYIWILVIRAVLSWVNPDPYNPIVRLLYQLTEPLLGKVRRWIPIRGVPIDFSPLIVLIIIVFLQSFLVQNLLQLSFHYR